MKRITVLVTVLFSFCLHALAGDSNATKPAQPRLFKITKIENLNLPKDSNHYSLGEYLVVTLDGTQGSIDTLVNSQKTAPLMLWLDNVPFPNLTVWQSNANAKQLTFLLDCDTSPKSAWNTLIGYEYWRFKRPYKEVSVHVGTADRYVTEGYKNKIRIYINEWWMIILGYSLILGIICFLLVLAKKWHVLQDGLPFDDSVQLVDAFDNDKTIQANQVLKKDLPYSLSRSQLWFWLIIVACSIPYIWLHLDLFASISTSTALLIGISGSTSVVTKIIEASDKKTVVKITAAQFYAGGYKKEGFFRDILSDAKGISLARAQMVMFTLLIGIHFIWHVYYYMRMPELSQGVLILMGISSGTYAGVKYNEPAQPQQQPQQ